MVLQDLHWNLTNPTLIRMRKSCQITKGQIRNVIMINLYRDYGDNSGIIQLSG